MNCICGKLLEPYQGKGRQRQYCSDRCRQQAKRNKDRSFRDKKEEGQPVTKLEAAHDSIKPILKYPGAKWKLAKWITSFFPDHEHYIEPYCGSAAVFFAKEPSTHEVLNDLNGSIVNLFRVIRTDGERLVQAIEMTPWAEEEYIACERDYIHEDPLEHARRFLIRCWQAHGVRLTWTSGWKHNGLQGRAYPVRLWQQLPDRILAVIDRLRDAEIRQRPALEIIDYYNAQDVLLYVDPPYPLSTRNDRLYSHEMSDADHVQLLKALDSHKGSVILSGYPCSLYDERLAHWQRVSVPAIAEHGRRRTEVLWLNPRAANRRQLYLFEEMA